MDDSTGFVEFSNVHFQKDDTPFWFVRVDVTDSNCGYIDPSTELETFCGRCSLEEGKGTRV